MAIRGVAVLEEVAGAEAEEGAEARAMAVPGRWGAHCRRPRHRNRPTRRR